MHIITELDQIFLFLLFYNCVCGFRSTPPTPASPLLQLPMSSPNQVLSQPPPTMFASSQDDKRYQRLQSLHDPPVSIF